MNIFYVDENPYKAAVALVDKHVVKMVLETAQILSTAHRVLDGVDGVLPATRDDILYKATHINHPSTKWAMESHQNYYWLVQHFSGLLKEYSFRYGKDHKCEELMEELALFPYNIRIRPSFREPPLAMPDEYKVPGDAVASYRNYYRIGKKHLHSWKKRSPPDWIY